MLVIAGLGNPGPEYAGHRHNVGFMAVDAIRSRHRFGPTRPRFEGIACEGVLADEKAMLMYTLRTAGEVVMRRDIPSISGGSTKDEEVRLARRVLEGFESGARLDSFVDNYESALKQMIKRKGAGEAVEAEEPDSGSPRKVVNLMDALRRSIEAAQSMAKRPRAASRKPAAPRAPKHAKRPVRRAS